MHRWLNTIIATHKIFKYRSRHPGFLALLCGFALMLGQPLAVAAGEDDAVCMDCHEDGPDESFNASWHVLHSAIGAGHPDRSRRRRAIRNRPRNTGTDQAGARSHRTATTER